MLLHHDEAIASNVRFKFKNNSGLYILSLKGKVSRRNSFIGRMLSKIFLKNFPELLYSFNTIGPSACFISKKKIFFNTELIWLVDVDFYYRTIISLNKREDIIFDKQCSIETFTNDNSITSKLDILKILVKERELLNLGNPNSFILYLFIKYKQLTFQCLKS